MTRLPHEDRNAVARLDLGPYELPPLCAVPGCGKPREPGGGHHVWRRSFGPSFREAWWVEVPGVWVFPNRLPLCSEHHRLITENLAEIQARLVDGKGELVYRDGHADLVVMSYPGVDMQLDLEGGEKPHLEVCEEHGIEETCPKCKGAGRVRRRPKRERKGRESNWRVLSFRVPANEQEDGKKALTDLLDQAKEIDRKKGIKNPDGPGSDYRIILASVYGYVLRDGEI